MGKCIRFLTSSTIVLFGEIAQKYVISRIQFLAKQIKKILVESRI